MDAPISKNRHSRVGFTLVELLVVMGIMVLLMGVLLPAVMHAMKAGRKSRVQADFQTISQALEAYKADFGDYPRFPGNGSGISNQWDMFNQRGAELLCRALIGPGPAFPQTAVSAGSPDNSGADGAGAGGSGDSTDANSKAAGPGFRTREGYDSNNNLQAQGKVWGPYVTPDKFRVFTLSTVPGLTTVLSSTNTTGTPDATSILLDSQGHSILYFPAALTTPNFSQANKYLADYADPNSPPVIGTQYLYNSFDNCSSTTSTGGVPPDPMNNPLITTALTQSDFYKLLGVDSTTGQVDAGQTPTYTGPYILWSAGEDNTFGISPRDGKSDDITNFDFPLSLRR